MKKGKKGEKKGERGGQGSLLKINDKGTKQFSVRTCQPRRIKEVKEGLTFMM